MEYLLAKELKDAGFPQNIDIGGKNYDQYGQLWVASLQARPLPPQDTYVPTLSELIEACAPSSDFILRSDLLTVAWYATRNNTEGRGDTPEEAVARLWLALKPK